MTGRHARPIQWLVSGYDDRKHAFYTVEQQGYLEALCGHSVPPDRLLATDRPKCIDCLMKHGADLADAHDTNPRWHD